MADQVQLPHVLSELAQIALDDVVKVEALPQTFEVDMGTWCRRRRECAVCAAGSVMVTRLSFDGEIEDSDELLQEFGAHNGAALLAIDAIRCGCVGDALDIISSDDPLDSWNMAELDPNSDDHELTREVASYSNRDQWHRDMTQLIADLKAAGL